MTGRAAFAYAQVRMQYRYGSRADDAAWLKLHAINDLGSYLQAARESSLRYWVLGISATHSSHQIEFTLRQKYRDHVHEVAGWMPPEWQAAVRWIKRLVDLPALQYLLAGGPVLEWMKSDPDFSELLHEDPGARARAMREAGYGMLMDAWQRDGSMMSGWLAQWNRSRPVKKSFERGLRRMESVLNSQMRLLARQRGTRSLPDYVSLADPFRVVFRAYPFQPAAACAWLAIAAIDVQHIRSDLVGRRFFIAGAGQTAEGSPV